MSQQSGTSCTVQLFISTRSNCGMFRLSEIRRLHFDMYATSNHLASCTSTAPYLQRASKSETYVKYDETGSEMGLTEYVYLRWAPSVCVRDAMVEEPKRSVAVYLYQWIHYVLSLLLLLVISGKKFTATMAFRNHGSIFEANGHRI